PSFFSIRLRPPPRPPLLPSTTLFRSAAPGCRRHDEGGNEGLEEHHGEPGRMGHHPLDDEQVEYRHYHKAGQGAPSSPAHRGVLQDRKSTRLNSSHVSISYAVFCLKKN